MISQEESRSERNNGTFLHLARYSAECECFLYFKQLCSMFIYLIRHFSRQHLVSKSIEHTSCADQLKRTYFWVLCQWLLKINLHFPNTAALTWYSFIFCSENGNGSVFSLLIPKAGKCRRYKPASALNPIVEWSC